MAHRIRVNGLDVELVRRPMWAASAERPATKNIIAAAISGAIACAPSKLDVASYRLNR
jgi:hypothetical protein